MKKSILIRFRLLVLGCMVASFSMAQNTIPKFEDGERVVFVGNSITHGGHYHSYVWLYYMTRFPNTKISVFNAGVGGDSAWDIVERMEEDVFEKNPTYVTMTFGMNDIGYYDFYKDNAQELAKEKVKKSYQSYQKIEEQLKKADDVTKVIIGGSPYDEEAKIDNEVFPAKNDALLKVNTFQKVSAENNGWGFVDFHRPMLEIGRLQQKTDSAFTLCGNDRIHPDNDGHMVMAYLFLKAQGFAGEEVANVDIDARKLDVEKEENCFISELKRDDENLEFVYLARALPYPVDTVARGWGAKKSQNDALNLIPFTEEFNQEKIKITGLSDGKYFLKIDGQAITEFTQNDLQNGINLAEYTHTPQYQQASKIMYLNEERFEIEKRFRDYAWIQFSFFQDKGLLFANNQEAMDTLRANFEKNIFLRGNFENYSKAQYPEVREVWQNQIDLIVNKIYDINKPVPRKIELVKM